jgi:hypothetical protein
VTPRWIAFFGCALISYPLLTPAGAQAQTAPTPNATIELVALSAPEQTRQFSYSGNQPVLTASAEQQKPMQWALNRELWTADDAIPGVSMENVNSNLDPLATSRDKSNCRWSFGVSSTWNCKIKPLTKHDFPVRQTLHYLWPLHDKNQ